MDANLELDNAGSGPLLARANLARIRSQWSEAVETCVRVLRVQPGNADAHSLLGDIHRDQGLLDDAIQWYRMAADLRPNGPDTEKLRKLESERDRRAALSGALVPATAAGAYEGANGGTTQLMGYSPKRWLNALTILSTCFLAAIVIILVVMRPGMSTKENGAHPLDLSSRPTLMPTAETGIVMPRADPNRPMVLPPGEQPKVQPKVHRTGDGLEPDRTNSTQPGIVPQRNQSQPINPQPVSSREGTLPTFGSQVGGRVLSQPARQNRELPPAPVQRVRPINSTFGVAGDGPPSTEDRQPAAQSQPRGADTTVQSITRDPSQERDPPQGLGAMRPAQENRAGEQTSNVGGTPSER